MFHLTIKSRIFLGLTAAIMLFLLVINIAMQLFLKDIANTEILQGLERSVKAFHRFDEQRGELLITQAESIAQIVYLKATLTIPDVDAETVFFATTTINEIAEMPLLLIIDYAGMLMADVNHRKYSANDLHVMPGMDRALQGETFSGNWQYDRVFYRVAISPIVVANQIVGFVAIGHPLNVPNVAQQIEEVSGSAAFLTFDDQLFPASFAKHVENQGQPGFQSPSDTVPESAVVGQSEGVELVFHEYSTQSYFSASIPLGNIPGHIMLYRAAYVMPGLGDPIQLILLVSSAILLLFGIMLSSSISSRISRPVLALTQASEEYAKGNFELRVHLENADEIAVLADGLNSMASELQRSRRDLITSKELAEAASRAKSTFLATMSHEIRTPLNGVLGMADLLAHTTELDDKQEHYVKIINESGRNLLDIIKDILDFSRIEAGKLQLDTSEFDLKTFAERTCKMYVAEVQGKGLKFTCEISEDASIIVIGDQTRLRQIMANLIGNAIKFTNSGGIKIKVSTLERQSEFVTFRFAVEDTGIGIEEDNLQKIFESFAQADDSSSRKFGGAGLGLAITRQLVELMGGSVHVGSVIGKGSTFFFDVTLKTCKLASTDGPSLTIKPESDRDPKQPKFNANILLVEDDLVNQEVALYMLQSLGCEVTIAEHGAAATATFEQKSIDLILMDMQMPHMDGLEASSKIREYETRLDLSPTPIIALTANAISGDRERCLAAGMDDYMVKPFTQTELGTALMKWLPVG